MQSSQESEPEPLRADRWHSWTGLPDCLVIDGVGNDGQRRRPVHIRRDTVLGFYMRGHDDQIEPSEIAPPQMFFDPAQPAGRRLIDVELRQAFMRRQHAGLPRAAPRQRGQQGRHLPGAVTMHDIVLARLMPYPSRHCPVHAPAARAGRQRLRRLEGDDAHAFVFQPRNCCVNGCGARRLYREGERCVCARPAGGDDAVHRRDRGAAMGGIQPADETEHFHRCPAIRLGVTRAGEGTQVIVACFCIGRGRFYGIARCRGR